MSSEAGFDTTLSLKEKRNIQDEYDRAVELLKVNARKGDLDIHDVLWFLNASLRNEQIKQPEGQRAGVIEGLTSEIDQINGKNIETKPLSFWQNLINFELRNVNTADAVANQFNEPTYSEDKRLRVDGLIESLERANMYANARATVQRHKQQVLQTRAKERI